MSDDGAEVRRRLGGLVLAGRSTVVVALAVSLLGSACSGSTSPTARPAPAPVAESHASGAVEVAADGSATATAGPWTVTLPVGAAPADATLTVNAAEGPPPASLDAGPSVTRVGSPVEVKLSSGQPAKPALLTLRLTEPIAEGAETLVVRHVPDTTQFVPYLAAIGADRMSMTATVDHFTWYDGIVFNANDFLSQRSDPPDCGKDTKSGKGVPTWVREANFLDDREAPATYCVGHDPKDPSVLVVKVAANRPYGFAAFPAAEPRYVYNTEFNSAGPEDLVKRSLQRLSGGSMPATLGGGYFLTPGAQLHLGFDEKSVRPSKNPLIRLSNEPFPMLVGLLYGMSIDALGDERSSPELRMAAATMVIVGLLQCGYDLFNSSIDRAFTAVGRCAATNWEVVATTVPAVAAAVFTHLDRAKLKQLCGQIARKLMWASIARSGYQFAEYVADTKLLSIAYELHIASTIKTKPVQPPAPSSTEEVAVAFVNAAFTGDDVSRYTADSAVAADAKLQLNDDGPGRYEGRYGFRIHPSYVDAGSQGDPPGGCQLIGDITVMCPVEVQRLDLDEADSSALIGVFFQSSGPTARVTSFEWIAD